MSALLALHLSPELAGADPAALRARAGRHRAEADALTAQATALRATVVRLVPAAWLGPGSLSFAGAALLQAGALEAIAAACAELGSALTALAAALDQARAEAETAVRSADRLDAEVAVEERHRAARPGPERPDPDPAVLDARAAAARALSGRLLAAEEYARRAWRQAAAVFDLVAHRMPDLAARMNGTADDGWRPSTSLTALPAGEWRHLVGASPVCAGGGWAGSGVLVGPDGRRYPVVVPWISDERGRWTADVRSAGRSVSTLDGADPGWHEIGVRFGIDTFGPPAGTATKAAIVTAGFVGNAPRMIGRLRPDLLPRLRWTTAGVPTVSATPAVPAPRGAGTGQVPRAALVRDDDGIGWTSDSSLPPPNRAARRASPDVAPGGVNAGRSTPVVPNLVGLTDSGLSGLSTARRLDDGRVAAYRATFEENDDGRVRARITTYQIRDGSDGATVLATDVSVQPDGALRREPVAYRPSQGPASAEMNALEGPA